jgi:hypothetical protein
VSEGSDVVIDGYVRVSQLRGREGESFISPVVRGDQIRAWATMRAAHVGRVFEELDASGAVRTALFSRRPCRGSSRARATGSWWLSWIGSAAP